MFWKISINFIGILWKLNLNYFFIDLYYGYYLKKNGIIVVLIKKEVYKVVIEWWCFEK